MQSGITTLNQAVLLRGINDDADALADLCERLIDLGVLPYYLHQLDRVRGAAHFEVAESRGLELIDELRRRLPGYAVPRYVREVAGAESKTVVDSGDGIRATIATTRLLARSHRRPGELSGNSSTIRTGRVSRVSRRAPARSPAASHSGRAAGGMATAAARGDY